MNGRTRYVLRIVALGAAYAIAGKLGLSLAFANVSASPVWPPAGIALATLLLWDQTLWPGIFLGAFLVNITTQGNLWTTLAIAAGNTAEGVLGAWLVNRFAGGMRAFDRPSNIFRFVIGAALLSTSVSATIGVTSLCTWGFAAWSDYQPVWVTWWLGDAVSDLTIAPFLITWFENGRVSVTAKKGLETLGLALFLGLIGTIVFLTRFSAFGGRKNPLGYLSMIPLLWAAFRFGQRGAATATLALCGIALAGTLHRLGPFVTPDMNLSLLLLQAFVGTTTVTVLVLAATVAESQATKEHLRVENAQRKEAEEAGRQSEERFHGIIDHSPAVIYLKDLEGRYLLINRRHRELFGKSKEEVVGKTPFDLFPEPIARKVLENDAAVIAAGHPVTAEEVVPHADGPHMYISVKFPLRNSEGKIYGIAGISTDITERVRAEQALKEAQTRLAKANQELETRVEERTASLRAALEQMEEFSYTVSHDLRAPLRGMQAYSKALQEDYSAALPTEASAYVKRIAENAARLDKMISDVLLFSRIAQAEITPQRVSLNRLVADLIRNDPNLQPPHAQIEVQPLLDVLGHEPSLTQVLSNLLGNAVKFVGPGVKPQVRVWTERLEGHVRLWVRDNGIGIPPKYQHLLFNMFERVHTDLNYEGTGVGLGIVKKAVERMGGRVGVDSDGANGSQFWIELSAPDQNTTGPERPQSSS